MPTLLAQTKEQELASLHRRLSSLEQEYFLASQAYNTEMQYEARSQRERQIKREAQADWNQKVRDYKDDKRSLLYQIAELEKEIEIEPQEPIEVERPEPIIEITPKKEIEIEYPDKVKVNARKQIVLKSRQLPKNNKDGNGNYDSVKLPSQSKDPRAWKKARAERLGASDISKFTSYTKDLPDFFKERFHSVEREFSDYQLESMEAGNFLEDRTHKKIARELAYKGKASLGNFKFSQVYLSKNRQYFSKDLPKLGAQLDAWGILDNKKAIIEIKSTNQFTFDALKNSLDLGDFTFGDIPSVQELLQETAPYYFYQIQAQMLATGITQAVLYVINAK